MSAAIPLLVPDMPSAAELAPWLERIDANRWYTNFGPLAQELEARIADDLGLHGRTPEVVALNNGTAPLELALDALGLPAGAPVLMPALSFPATAGAALRRGLTPLFGDVSADDWQLTPTTAREVAERRPVALVMPVATFGAPVAVEAWDAFSADTGIPVLIDAAAAFGNQVVGERTHVAFSFHATKPFSTGEGGALVTRDSELAARVRRLSNFGFEGDLVNEVGTNAKLSEYAAAVGLAQWARRTALHTRRRALWSHYAAALETIPGVEPQPGLCTDTLPATLVVRLATEAAVVAEALEEAGIESRRWYYPPLHRHPAFAHCPCSAPGGGEVLPLTEALARHTLGLPWFPAMSTEQCDRVATALTEMNHER